MVNGWALLQGLSYLLLEGPFTDMAEDPERLVEDVFDAGEPTQCVYARLSSRFSC
jgi:hypothetical protein